MSGTTDPDNMNLSNDIVIVTIRPILDYCFATTIIGILRISTSEISKTMPTNIHLDFSLFESNRWSICSFLARVPHPQEVAIGVCSPQLIS
jgi:hypothetical protein